MYIVQPILRSDSIRSIHLNIRSKHFCLFSAYSQTRLTDSSVTKNTIPIYIHTVHCNSFEFNRNRKKNNNVKQNTPNSFEHTFRILFLF